MIIIIIKLMKDFNKRKKMINEFVLPMLFPNIKEEDFQIQSLNHEKSEVKNLEVIGINQEK